MNSVGYVLNQLRTAMLGGMCPRWRHSGWGNLLHWCFAFEMGNMAWWAAVLLNEYIVLFLVDGHSPMKDGLLYGTLVLCICFGLLCAVKKRHPITLVVSNHGQFGSFSGVMRFSCIVLVYCVGRKVGVACLNLKLEIGFDCRCTGCETSFKFLWIRPTHRSLGL